MGRTILVADDSPTIQKKASGILTGEGLDVVTVSNGVAAVKKLPTVNPLVVLADVSMPGKDGYEVCEHIKSNASLAHISVLLVYSDTDPYEDAKGARVGADGKIKKPFERDDLISTVTKFLAQSEAALAPKPAPAPPPPPDEYEVQPIDEEQEVAARQEAPDLSALTGGMAFGVPSGDEVPSTPADASTVEPMMAEPFHHADEGGLPTGEVIEEVSPFAAVEAEHAADLPAPDTVEPMLVEEAAVEAAPEEDTGERTMMFRAPADIAQPMLSDEVEAEPHSDPLPLSGIEAEPSEPAPVEAATPVEEVQPAEEAVQPEPFAAGPPPSEALAPVEDTDITPPGGTSVATQTLSGFTLSEAAAGRIRFGMAAPEVQQEPEVQHEPEVQQELEVEHEPDRERPAPPPEPPPVAEAPVPERAPVEEEVEYEVAPPGGIEIPPPQEAHAEEAPASPAEEAAPPAEEPAPAPEPVAEEAAAPAEAAAPPAAEPASAEKAIDVAQVSSIVHKVVVKMSPPALSQQMIDDIANRFTDEIIAELKSES